jgi:glutamate/tyrosine decarboxylase-like PLP-dependent enzyme
MTRVSTRELRTESALDISSAALEEISAQVNRLVFEYFETIRQRDVIAPNRFGETLSRLTPELSSDGVPLEKLLNECRTMIDLSRHNGHPRFFGYVASPATAAGAYADLIASSLNANITCWRSGPAGTELEKLVVKWLGTLIGYDADARGILTSGGSMANLIALLVASRKKAGRQAAQTGLWNSKPLTIYASSEVHLSIAKAADILGLGRDQVRTVRSDSKFRLDTQSLRETIQSDLERGMRPCCVVASAGTVNTGTIDPLAAIATVAQEFDLWFHIDGAYGAPGVLDERKSQLFDGLSRADSVSLDPHKWLYVPVDAGCLLFRDDAAVKAAFSTDEADYIKVHGLVDDETFAFWDYGIELSRRFRALRIWLTLQYFGSRRIAEAIRGDISLAAYLGELVEEAEDFELMAPVELSICCFRYVRKGKSEAELDGLNENILTLVQKGGQAYVSNATIGGRFALRACITNFRTTKFDIEQTIAVIREAAEVVG